MTEPSLGQGQTLNLLKDYYSNAYDVLVALIDADTAIKIALTNAVTGEEIFFGGINLIAPSEAPLSDVETYSIIYITNLITAFGELRDAYADELAALECDE